MPHLSAHLHVVTAAIDADAVAQVQRVRPTRHRKVRVVAERLEAGQHESWGSRASIGGRAGPVMPRAPKPSSTTRERRVLPPKAVPAQTHLVEDAARQHL